MLFSLYLVQSKYVKMNFKNFPYHYLSSLLFRFSFALLLFLFLPDYGQARNKGYDFNNLCMFVFTYVLPQCLNYSFDFDEYGVNRFVITTRVTQATFQSTSTTRRVNFILYTSILTDFIPFFTSISRLSLSNGNIVFGQIFDVEFSPDLCIWRSSESRKVFFENWCVCVAVR